MNYAVVRSGGKRSSSVVRIVIAGQTILVMLLLLAMYFDYRNNPYLQSYINSALLGGSSAEMVFGLILLGSLVSGVFTITVAWRYGKTIPVVPRIVRTLSVQPVRQSSLAQESKDSPSKVVLGGAPVVEASRWVMEELGKRPSAMDEVSS